MYRNAARLLNPTAAAGRGRTGPVVSRQFSTADTIQFSHASPSPQDYSFFWWKPRLGTRYTQLQIVNALRLGERERAFKMLVNLGDTDVSLGPDDFSFVLDYCARTPDPLFVMETWRIMVEKAVAIDMRCCRFIAQAFSKGGYLKEASNWLGFIGESDFAHAMLPLYNIFLGGCAARQNFINADADRCMELMERQLVGKSEITYWELLKLAVLRRNLLEVHDIWKDCTKYYTPSVIALRKFIWSFTRLNALESAYATLQYMIALAVQESSPVRVSSAGRYQSSRLDIPIPSCNELLHMTAQLKGRFNLELFHAGSGVHDAHEKDIINSQLFPSADESGNDTQCLGKEEFAELDLENMKLRDFGFGSYKAKLPLPIKKILRWAFNNVIHAFVRAKKHKLAERLFLQMDALGVEPSRDTYDGFVKAVLLGKGVTQGMHVISSLEKRNIKPYNDTFAAVSTAYSKNLELDIAEDLLENISDGQRKYVHPFNALLAACDVMDQPDRAVHILAKMKHLKIKSNIRTYELLFSLFGNVNAPYEKGNIFSHGDVSKRIHAIEKDMIRSGVHHSYTSMKNLISALGGEGMTREMLQCLHRAENMCLKIDPHQKSDMHNIVLHALVKAKESYMAVELFKNMRLSGFPADVAIYNMMIECCSTPACYYSASAVLSLMIRDGFPPQTLTYTSLIKVLLAGDDFDGAVSLLSQASSEGIQLDIHLFNTILKQAYLKGRIDIIELIIQLIHSEKIQPDPSTCWYTFSAYVELGFYSTAMEALQVLSLRMISEDDSVLQHHKALYEDLLYGEEPDVESKIVDIFKESQESIATALLSLRWCAINGMQLLWSPEESIWAKRLSSSLTEKQKKYLKSRS